MTTGLPPLPGDDPVARHRLPSRVVGYWRLQHLAVGVLVVGTAAAGAALLPVWLPWVRWSIVAGLALYLLVFEALLAPPIRYRVRWYSVSADEIDLQHGALFRTRTVIPMNRVQHLRTHSGPLARRYRIASLHIHTAGGEIEFAGLDVDEAERLRTAISRMARLADDV